MYPSGKKIIVVAGGAGFIGSHLCQQLVKDNHVIAVDDFSSSQVDNIQFLLQNPNFKLVKHDLTKPLDLEIQPDLEIWDLKIQGVQEIYHLACPDSPKLYSQFALQTALTASEATKNLLDLAVKHKAKFLYTSTVSVYGQQADYQVLKNEVDSWGVVNPLGKRSGYLEGKRYAETLTKLYAQKYQLATKIVRVANTYGPHMQIGNGRMIPDFVEAALANQPLIVYGDKQSGRTFCYVTDVVQGLVKVMDSTENDVFNLGSSDRYLVREVAQGIINLLASKSTIEFQDFLPQASGKLVPDIRKIRDKCGWLPLVSLEKGLQQTVRAMQASKLYRG